MLSLGPRVAFSLDRSGSTAQGAAIRQERYHIPKTTIWSAAQMQVDRHGARAAEVVQAVIDETLLDEDEMRAWKSVKLAI